MYKLKNPLKKNQHKSKYTNEQKLAFIEPILKQFNIKFTPNKNFTSFYFKHLNKTFRISLHKQADFVVKYYDFEIISNSYANLAKKTLTFLEKLNKEI